MEILEVISCSVVPYL